MDFADGTADGDRAGLEAALEASGLLDAWVTADDVLLDPLTRDTLLDPQAPAPAGATLGEVLRPVPAPGSGVTAERIERVLSAVAFAPLQDTAAANAVYHDGGWRLGALRGRHAKNSAEYVGAAVRAETRLRRLAELDLQIAEVEGALGAERRRLADVDSWRRSLAVGRRSLPKAHGLASAWARFEAAEKRVTTLTGKAALAAREAARARADAVSARRIAENAASAHDLPTVLDSLTGVRNALKTLSGGLERLSKAAARTIGGLDGNRGERSGHEDAQRTRRKTQADYETGLDRLRPEDDRLRTLENTVGAAAAEVLVREKAVEERIGRVIGMLPGAKDAHADLYERRIRTEEDEKKRLAALEAQEEEVIAVGGVLRGALNRPEVVRGAGLGAASLLEGRADEPAADTRTRIRVLRGLAEAVRERLDRPKSEVSDSALLNRHTELRDQLAGGYDAQLEERDRIKVCRLIDDHGTHDVAVAGERIAARAAEARGRLTERESEVFQRFLTGELGDHLSEQVIAAAALVAALNDTLRTVRTSHGLGVELQWRLHEDVDADVRAAVELLRSPSRLRSRDETERLREVLQRRIEDARKADPSAGYAAHLHTALDYRDWFRFDTFVVEDAVPGRKRKLTGRTGLSQGEQRVLSYLVLFAAASAPWASPHRRHHG